MVLGLVLGVPSALSSVWPAESVTCVSVALPNTKYLETRPSISEVTRVWLSNTESGAAEMLARPPLAPPGPL